MPNNIKIKRYESIIQDVINKAIIVEINDAKLKSVRVTYVRLTNDLSQATINIDAHYKNKTTLDKLNKLSGFFRSKVASSLDIYKTPKLIFKFDKSIEYAQNIDKIINDIKHKDK